MKCLVCDEPLNSEPVPQPGPNNERYECANCGTFTITALAKSELAAIPLKNQIARSVLSHALRKMQANGTPLLTESLLKKIIERPLPTAPEQCDNLILWLGNSLSFAGRRVWINPRIHRAVLGAVNEYAFGQVIQHLEKQGLLDLEMRPNGLYEAHTTLSVDGWVSYEKLRRDNPQSRVAFMAMQFDNQDLDRLVKNVFKPAVCKTGFDLRRLDEKPRAGLIDDRLRVEIRNARFLIADLTDDNEGAYWEAGFAEGLGKPVIFICEEAKFEEKKTHFDTNHHLTVKWDKGSPQGAAEELKATIRATLPDEARMTDD
jgi:hypothetical protein